MAVNDPLSAEPPNTGGLDFQGHPVGGVQEFDEAPAVESDSAALGSYAVERDAPLYPSGPDIDESSAESSTSDVVKDQAAQVGQGAADAGQRVAGVAKDQVGNVAGEAKAQAADLASRAQSEVAGQADAQKQRLAELLHSVSQELHGMVEGSDQDGVVTDAARQASQRVHQAASWLEGRDPGALLEEVRSFARRRPGAFLGIALAGGIVAGRLTRGLTSGDDATTGASPDSYAPVAGASGADHLTSPVVAEYSSDGESL